MPADANRTLGGKFYINANGTRMEVIGELTLQNADETRTGKATSGGRAYVTVEAKPFGAKCKFANIPDGDPIDFFDLRDGINVTFVESTRGIRHIYTNASVVGTPDTNVQTGEVDGIEIITDTYERTGP